MSDPERCDSCGRFFEENDEVVTLYTETVRDPNGELQFEERQIDTRRHVTCP